MKYFFTRAVKIKLAKRGNKAFVFQAVPFMRTIGTYEGAKTLKRTVIVSQDDALCSEREVSFFS